MISNSASYVDEDVLNQVFADISAGLHAAAQPLTILKSIFDEDTTVTIDHVRHNTAAAAAGAVTDLCRCFDDLQELVARAIGASRQPDNLTDPASAIGIRIEQTSAQMETR